MKTIAFFSRDHKCIARILIVVCHILIYFLGHYIGSSLQKDSLFISPVVFWISTALFLVIIVVFSGSYPTFSFSKRKTLDGSILLCAFMMIVSFSNQKSTEHFIFYNSLHGSFKEKAKPSGSVTKPSVKELRKQFKEFKKSLKEGHATTGGILLAILAAALLGMLVAAASCSLGCNGHDALAVLTLIGGITAIFFICRLIIRGTRKRNLDALIHPNHF